MKKASKMFIPDGDYFFREIFEQTGDRFDDRALEEVLGYDLDFTLAVDVGAHVGSWTRRMADRFDAVIAVEANYDNYKCLVKNIEEYENVRVMCGAASNKPGFCRLCPGLNPDNSGAFYIDTKGENAAAMFTIDDLGLHSCGLLKIDVEGHEQEVVEGAEATILRNKPVIIAEENGLCGRYGHDLSDLGEYMSSLGYRLRARVSKDSIYDHESRMKVSA